jgi:hypothetical protein
MLVALGRAGHTTTLTWRFVHDVSGWRAMVTLRRRLDPVIVDFAQGAIGLDLKRRKGYRALWGGHRPPVGHIVFGTVNSTTPLSMVWWLALTSSIRTLCGPGGRPLMMRGSPLASAQR